MFYVNSVQSIDTLIDKYQTYLNNTSKDTVSISIGGQKVEYTRQKLEENIRELNKTKKAIVAGEFGTIENLRKQIKEAGINTKKENKN